MISQFINVFSCVSHKLLNFLIKFMLVFMFFFLFRVYSFVLQSLMTAYFCYRSIYFCTFVCLSSHCDEISLIIINFSWFFWVSSFFSYLLLLLLFLLFGVFAFVLFCFSRTSKTMLNNNSFGVSQLIRHLLLYWD